MTTFRQDTKIGGMVPMMKTDDINDQAITKDKIRDGNVTAEKLADGAVSTEKLPDGAIKTPKIADGNITTSKLAEASVVTSKIADQNVTNEKIADQSVDNSKLSPEAVTYDKLKDKSVITEKLNDRAVTTEKVEEKAITNAKIGDSAVDGRTIGEASVEKKHLANDSVATEKLQDSSVTSDKIHTNAVTEEKIEDSAISNPKLADNSVGTSKIKDGNVTNEKVANNTLTIDKFDPELRKSIQAATGLPDNLVEVIQDVDVEVKSLHSKDEDLQSQIADKQQQITANDKDIESLQTRSTQMEQSINNIAVTGGASVANTVAYSNTASGLVSINAQGAIDELAAKNATKAEKAEVTAELEKKFDKESILQESGDAEDKVMSQKAVSDKLSDLSDMVAIKDEEGNVVETPFRYIQSEEFIFAKVDVNDRLLFGIQWDGTPVFGKTSAVEDRLQTQVTLLAERVATIMGDEDTTNVIDTMNELKKFFAEIENTETLTGILANLDNVAKNLDKTTIKDEEGNVQDTPFRVIENEEFIKAIVDSDDKVLFGFYRATGNPYFPLNEMYHVEQNEEFFALWLDADDKILLGIRRDGQIIGEINAVNALKQVIAQLQSDVAALQEKVGTIDTNLKELLDVFSLQENPEYMAVETDAEGKILSSTNPDGSHYIYNAKSETIPTEFEHIEDIEGRTEITTDADNKILGYRDSEGTRHEHKISAKHLELSREAANEVNDAFKSAGIKMENPSDFSKYSHIELPIPRIAAQVRLYAPSLPATKQDDIEAEIEYNDKDGNYFRKPVILNAQGSSSMNYYVKNMAIDITDGSEVKFGDFPTQDSFHLKKYYIDAFRGQCIVGYWLMEQVYKSRPLGQQYPYELSIQNTNVDNGFGDIKKDFFSGAKCHPDGFPIVITWIDNNGNETNMGVYTWNLKKSKEVYYADKKKAENIILDGLIHNDTLWGGNIKWEEFEVRNPKSLKDINGNKYDGDNPKELSETDELSKKVKDYIIRWSGCKADIDANKTKETFEKYFLINPFIDYYIVSQLLYNFDGFSKNWIWCTWDGLHWAPTLYDVDSIFGSHWAGVSVVPNSDNSGTFDWKVLGFSEVYDTEIKSRYKELRDLGIFSVDNIMKLLNKWLNQVGFDNLKKDLMIYDQTPSYRSSNINTEYWKLIRMQVNAEDMPYNEAKAYNVNDTCYINLFVFQCVKECSGISPFTGIYSKEPRYGGYFNSPIRVRNWLTNRIKFLDSYYKYTI